jgi:putative hydrolase of the HAD superfamily
MIKAIIFDFGRVISAQKPMSLFTRYEQELDIPAGKLNRVMFGSPAWQDVLVGKRKVDDYWREIGPELGLDSPEAIESFRRRYSGDEALNEDVADLIRSLRGRYKLAVLSNAPSGLSRWLEEWELLSLFDEVVVSGEEGVAKPDAAIFELTLARLGIAPEEAVFIDDSPTHVKAARSLGIHALLFTTAANLLKELEPLLETP